MTIKPEFNLDFHLDNLRIHNLHYIKVKNVRTQHSADEGMKIKMVCLRSANSDINESDCLQYAPFYIDSRDLLALDTKMVKLKSGAFILDQPSLFRIPKPMNQICTVGDSYRTFFMRLCQVPNSQQIELEVVDFENIVESRMLLIANQNIKDLELLVFKDWMIIVVRINKVIKNVFVYDLGQIGKQGDETVDELLRLSTLQIELIHRINTSADDMIVFMDSDLTMNLKTPLQKTSR